MINDCDSHLRVRSQCRAFTRRDALRLAQLYWVTVIVAFALLAVPLSAHQGGMAQAHKPKDAGKLYDFKIAKPNFVVSGANLGKAEIWFWSTGTGITKPALIGTAKRITNEGKSEKWVLQIPPNLLAVEIFVTAFDTAGNEVGKKSLPYKDPGALYNAMYGKQ
jgi:hypothetical protein